MTYHSECGQDQWLEENVFKGKRYGVFCEAGALNGVLHSNTLFFERERVWSGVLIEANPFLSGILAQNRPGNTCINKALWDSETTVPFKQIMTGFYGWSGIVESFEPETVARIDGSIPIEMTNVVDVATITLNQALGNIPYLDYLSLDLEGAELRVLKAFDFSKCDIKVIGVEVNFSNDPLFHLLQSKGYTHLARVGQDEIWLKSA